MVRIDPATLEAFAADLLEAVGVPAGNAARVAASLVAADRRGHASHGVLRVPYYADLIGETLVPDATPTVERRAGSAVGIDGRGAFGQVVGREAVDLAVDLAREEGVAAVGIGGTGHLGRVGEWAERAADAGIALGAFVKARSRLVAPPGTAERRLSTNPIAWGVPTFDGLPFDVVLDMATSQVAHGKIRDRALSGDPVPDGWTIDAGGEPVRDAAAFEDGAGAMRPLGGGTSGYKGFGLAVLVELLAGTAGDAPVAGEGDHTLGVNDALFVAVDPTRFTTRERTAERAAALAAYLRDAERDPGASVGPGAAGEGALLPGEAEHRAAERARREGIDLSASIADSLSGLARERGVAVPAALSGD